MTGLVRGARVGLLALAVVGLTTWGALAKPPRPPRPGGPERRDRPAEHLRRAYDTIGVVALGMRSDRIKLPRETAGLLDQAKTFYRRAERAYRDGERRQAEELALAANDAARGLLHRIRAEAPAVAGLPAPPAAEGPEPDDILRRARERLADAEESRGPARAFLDAGRRAYDQARKVWRDDPARAAELARAAEAWTHVGEHLTRADDERAEAPRAGRRGRPEPPDDRPRRPRPPREPEDGAPPPPPPLR